MAPDFTEKMSAGKNSKWALGYNYPDPKSTIDKDGYKIPCGKMISNPKMNCRGYNEFIVYDPAQVKMRYLVKFKMN